MIIYAYSEIAEIGGVSGFKGYRVIVSMMVWFVGLMVSGFKGYKVIVSMKVCWFNG